LGKKIFSNDLTDFVLPGIVTKKELVLVVRTEEPQFLLDHEILSFLPTAKIIREARRARTAIYAVMPTLEDVQKYDGLRTVIGKRKVKFQRYKNLTVKGLISDLSEVIKAIFDLEERYLKYVPGHFLI